LHFVKKPWSLLAVRPKAFCLSFPGIRTPSGETGPGAAPAQGADKTPS
jgi:hypothetical protein